MTTRSDGVIWTGAGWIRPGEPFGGGGPLPSPEELKLRDQICKGLEEQELKREKMGTPAGCGCRWPAIHGCTRDLYKEFG